MGGAADHPTDETGREALFNQWLSRYGDDVTRVCYDCLRDYQLAQDAAQETFLKAWRHMDSFFRHGGDGEKTWMMRIAVNTCRDCRRSAWFKRVNRSVTPDQLPESATESGGDAELWMTVGALPVKQREALLLYYYESLTYEEISRVLSVSVSTVARRLEKALKALRRAIGEDEDDA